MEGLLNDPQNGWHVVYTDVKDGYVMVVGDDPWQLSISYLYNQLVS